MKTIKALQTIAGVYGTLTTDQTAEVSDRIANDLEEKGLVSIEGDAGKDVEGVDYNPDSHSGFKGTEKHTGIKNNTKSEKKVISTKAEKNAKAGPVVPENKEAAKTAEGATGAEGADSKPAETK